jgi:hypothetical protein
MAENGRISRLSFKALFQNASERQRNFEQAVSVRFWTNRAAIPPAADWAQLSAI